MPHEDVQELTIRNFFLQFIGRTVTDWRVTENWPSAHLDVVIQFLLLLHEVLAQARLLLLARLQLGKVDTVVELGELVLTAHLDTIELPRVVSELLLDFGLGHTDVGLGHFTSSASLGGGYVIRDTISFQRISAFTLRFVAPVKVVFLPVALELDTFRASGRALELSWR